MTEEIRTTRAVVDVGFGGSEADFIASLGQIDAKLAQTIQDLERFRRQNGTVSQGLLAVDDATGKLSHSFDNMAAQAKAAFGSDALKGYVAGISQATMAFNTGALAPAEYAAAMKRLEMQLPGLTSQFKVSTQELGRFVLRFNEARAAAEQEARAQGLVGLALEKSIQKRTEARIVQERETEATKRQTAAVAQLEAAENNRRYAQQNRLQVQGIAPRGAALTQTETQEQRGAAIELGLRERATEAEAYAASLNKLSVASRALQSEAHRLQAEEDQLNKIFALGDLSASAYRNSLSQVIASKRELAAQYNGEAAERARVIRLEAEETQTLQRLRQAYGEVETASQRLQVELRELNAQFILGNVGLREFLALRARATAAASPVGPVPGFNASQLGERPLTSNVSAYNAETQRLASTYDLAGEAARRFATDQTLLNERLAANKLTTQQHATMMNNLAVQQKAVEDSGKGLGNTYQRQQILQAGLVNTFQSLAAGQGVMSTLFIQSTQLVGAFGQVNLAMLGIATAGLVVTAAVVGLGVAIAKTGDEAILAKARIEALGNTAGVAQGIYDQLQGIGIRQTGIGANESAGMFSRLLVGAESIGATNQQVIRLTQSFQQLGIIGGGTSQQISAGMQQFVQAMGKGKLDGDELKSIMENLPLLARELATGLGVAVGSLRDMGAAGQLTSERVFTALLSRTREIDEVFQNLPVTMNRGFGQLAAAIQGILVSLNEAIGLSSALGRAASAAARAIDGARVASAGTPEERSARADQQEADARRRLDEADRVIAAGEGDGGLIARIGLGIARRRREAALQDLYAAGAARDAFAPLREGQRINEAQTRMDAGGVAEAAQRQREADEAFTYLSSSRNQRRFDPRGTVQETFVRDQNAAQNVIEFYSQSRNEAAAVINDPAASAEARASANQTLVTSLIRVNAAQVALTEAEEARARALARLDAAGAAAGRREENRVEALQRAVSRASENVNEVGASRSVRAFGELSEKLQAVYMDQNETARAGGLLRTAQDALTASTRRASQEYAESNRSISLTTQSLEDKNNISRLEALGTRAALEEIDGITRTRELERAAIEETNATRTVSANIRALEVQLAEQEKEGNTAATQKLRERLEVEQQQLTTVQSLYEARRAAINDPANGRLGQELAQQQRQAIDYATKLSADYMYDVFTGKISQIGAKLKETLLRAIADGISNQIIRPIIAPIIAGAVNMVSGPGGLLGGGSSLASSLGSLWGGSSPAQQAIVASNTGSWSGAMNQASQTAALASAGRFGNLGNAFTNQGYANTGFGMVDGVLNSHIISPSYLAGNTDAALGALGQGVYGPASVADLTNSALGSMGSGVYGPAAPAALGGGVVSPGLTTAGAIGGAAGVLGGAYSIYSGVQKGGIGGGVGIAGGVAGMAGGAATLLGPGMIGGLAAFGPYGLAAAAILAVVSALLPGEKASGKGQLAYEDLYTGSQGFAGLSGDRFSQGNRDQAQAAVDGISELSRSIGDALGGMRIGGTVGVGVTSSRGNGPGQLYLDYSGRKGTFENTEEGAKALAEQATTFLLDEYRKQAEGDYKGILNASGNSIERLFENLDWYKNVYQAFQDTGEAASAYQKSLDSVRSSYQPTIDKANELSLSTEKLTQARDKELAAVEKQRNDQLLEIREQLSLRETLVAGDTGYQQIADMFQRVNWRTAETELESLKNTLKDLGLTTAETAVEVDRLRAVQGAEYWKNLADSMAALDRSVTSRILRATGREGEADMLEFEAAAAAEVRDLSNSLAKLGLSAEVAAGKIIETEQAIAAERMDLQQRVAQVSREAEMGRLAEIKQQADQRLSEARNSLLDVYNRESSALDQTRTRFEAFARSLASFRQGLLQGDLTPLSPENQLSEARQRFNSVAARAQLGDAQAIEELQGSSQDLLRASRNYYASSEAYYRDFTEVQRVLAATETVADRHARIAGDQLGVMRSQLTALGLLNDGFQSFAESLAAYIAAGGTGTIKTGGGTTPTPTPTNYGTAANAAEYVAQIEAGTQGDFIARADAYLAANADVAAAISAGTIYPNFARQEAALIHWRDFGQFEGRKFADGGYAVPGVALVGERGPELVDFRTPARVYTAEQTRGAFALGNSSGSERSMERVAREIATLRAEMQRMIQRMIQAGERTADAAEDTAQTNARMAQRDSIVGRRARAA